ncbi:hypothetical protein HGP14_02320 [Rhizobium sp. P32RR-XVIII]|uniref:hypothetical protein n=1 Tax=Rhizobium sp. P32RR-XVIII TaxID=2726738 RepID=UPI001456E77E|nr:hypothetical protein [Rhizobium sp. P32RR-XVIII]NLS02204.1 hypothetical protein [Rhizobium sp. P32RR-XVIII]
MQSNATAARPAAQRQAYNLTYSASFMLPALRACILTAGLLVAPTSLYAACGFEGIPEQYQPYNLSEGTTNSMGQPVTGGEAASTRAAQECQEEHDRQSWYQTLGIATDDNTETLFKGVTDSFKAGGSIIFNFAASYQRSYRNPADPDFDPRRWLEEHGNKYRIEEKYLYMFGGTRSQAEAYALLAHVNERKAAQARIQRMGTAAQMTAKAVATIPDITITLLSLAAFSMAVRPAFRRTGKPERATTRT